MAAPPAPNASLGERADADTLSTADQYEPGSERRNRNAWTTDLSHTKQSACAGRLCLSDKPASLFNTNERAFSYPESYHHSASRVRAYSNTTTFRCASTHAHGDKRDSYDSSL